MPNEPQFSDFYEPSPTQKQGELVFIGGGLAFVSYAAWKFLQYMDFGTFVGTMKIIGSVYLL